MPTPPMGFQLMMEYQGYFKKILTVAAFKTKIELKM